MESLATTSLPSTRDLAEVESGSARRAVETKTKIYSKLRGKSKKLNNFVKKKKITMLVTQKLRSD